jgi:hypothetical protein
MAYDSGSEHQDKLESERSVEAVQSATVPSTVGMVFQIGTKKELRQNSFVIGALPRKVSAYNDAGLQACLYLRDIFLLYSFFSLAFSHKLFRPNLLCWLKEL